MTVWVADEEDYLWHRLWYRDDYGFLVTVCRLSLDEETAAESDDILIGSFCPECVPDPSEYGFEPIPENELRHLSEVATETMRRIRAELGDDDPWKDADGSSLRSG